MAKYYQLTCAIPDSLYILYEHEGAYFIAASLTVNYDL